MTREEAIKELTELLPEEFLSEYTDAIKMAIKALEAESRMKYVQETVNTIMNACDTDSIADKAMRNAAKFVQNAIDGSYPDFEKLEQEHCDDAISRKAVIDTLTKTSGIRGDDLKALYNLPSVSAQPKMARWEKHDVRGQRVDCCSVCGLSNGTIYEYNYCPNCGAKMENEI